MRDNQTFPNDPQQEEIGLEKSGDICALQRHRWDVWLKQDIKDWKLDFIRVLFITETRLRENTQREMMLREKLQRLEESPTHYKAAEIQDLRDKIQISSEQYWWKERFWWVIARSREASTFGVQSRNGICIVCLLKTVLQWEDVAEEIVDVVQAARIYSDESLQLVIALLNVLVVRKLGDLNSALSLGRD
ncbi:hypothetical protein N7517_001552 [Penicillium concentricum]|uniref:Uncharacterized protein n=1 Tax=Penicillium concentricum TaxID=293559 RepID=A0A9W9SS14_9EURO|nr:uncharacterized protein N7517_001552 [Penicillium concentricum]KAJ5383641.1 hypothetical protein N7517_001552 [Penicillium concentricum]